MIDPTDLYIGMRVRKAAGYDWPGIIVNWAAKSDGNIVVSVENRLCPGTIHIFPPHLLMAEDRSDDDLLAEVAERLLK